MSKKDFMENKDIILDNYDDIEIFIAYKIIGAFDLLYILQHIENSNKHLPYGWGKQIYNEIAIKKETKEFLKILENAFEKFGKYVPGERVF